MSPFSVVPAHEREEHLQAVRDRLAEGEEGVRERVARVSQRVPDEQRQRLLTQAVNAGTVAQRIHWLRREADVVLKAVADVAACGRGCAHCCHIGTSVAEPEAIAIGKAIGRAPRDVAADRSTSGNAMMTSADGAAHPRDVRAGIDADFFGLPCTFLTDDGECSIYEYRPMSCRHLVNFDVDELLCRLVPGEAIRVPYLNRQMAQLAYVMSMGVNARIADIRDWFPKR